jgi:hypothetical protein
LGKVSKEVVVPDFRTVEIPDKVLKFGPHNYEAGVLPN